MEEVMAIMTVCPPGQNWSHLFICIDQVSSSTPSSSTFEAAQEMTFSAFDQLTVDMLEVAIYVICLLIGGPLNVFAFFVNMKQYRAKTNRFKHNSRIQLLRINLNIADLLTMFIYTLTQIVWLSTYQWYGGDILCRVIKFFYTFCFYLNSFIVVCIAVDRVFGTYNINAKQSNTAMQRVRRMLIGAWTAAILFSLPQVFIFRLAQPSPGFSQCAPIWSITTFRVIRALTAPNLDDETRVLLETEYVQIVRLEKLYNLMHLLVLFWVPVLIIAVCYVVVLLLLKELADHEREKDERHRLCKALLLTVIDTERQNGKSMERRSISSAGDVTRGEGDGEGDGQMVEADADSGCEAHSLDEGIRTIKRGRQNYHSNNSTNALSLRTIGRARQVATRQAACILAAYLILWTPYNVMAAICAFFRPGDDEKNAWAATLTFLNALLVVNAIANPVIYGLTNNPKNRRTQSRS